MPVIVAAAVRFLIMAAVQVGAIALWEKFGQPLLDSAIVAVSKAFGATQQQAEDIVGNQVIQAFEAVGITALVIKSRIPVKAADRLGFTTRGYSLKTVPASLQSKGASVATASLRTAVASASEVATVAAEAAATKGTTLTTVKTVLGVVATVVGVPTAFLYMLAQFIDYASWSGSAYQDTFQKLFSIVGLTPDKPIPKSSVLSSDVWDKVYNTFKENGAVGISDPFKLQTLLFSRQNVIDLVDKLGAAILADGGTASAKNILGATAALVIYSGGKTFSGGTPAASTTASGSGGTTAPPAAVTQIKVYTGVVANGTLGVPQAFVSRPDDMIDNLDELKAAAKNNLATFVQSLPGRFSYEIAVVSTVKTKAGNSLRGEAVKIITGYYKNGAAKTKTIYNKFATMKLIVTDENGKVIKLATINLGPVNSVDFQPTNSQLSLIQEAISPELFTSDITQIKTVVSPSPLGVTATPPPNPNAPANTTGPALSDNAAGVYQVERSDTPEGFETIYYPPGTTPNTPLLYAGAQMPATQVKTPLGLVTVQPVTYATPTQGLYRNTNDFGSVMYKRESDNTVTSFSIIDPRWGLYPAGTVGSGTQAQIALQTLKDKYNFDWFQLPAFNVADRGNNPDRGYTGPSVADFLGSRVVAGSGSITVNANVTASTPQGAAAKQASTLAAFYAAVGQSLPSLSDRGLIYERANLGAASTYIGTAEQNNKLLSWLQGNL